MGELQPPVIVRCWQCEATGIVKVMPIAKANPVRLHGYRINEYRVPKETLDDIFLCEEHYQALFETDD